MTRPRDVRGLMVGLISACFVLGGCGDSGTGPENQGPSASISSPADGASFVEGAEVSFRGSASDPDQGSLSGSALSWASDRDGDLGDGATVSRSDLSVGDHVVTLTATDDAGATGTATVSITVAENQEPTASISSPPDDTTYGQGAPIEFRGSGDDPEDGELTGSSLEWTSDLDGSLGTDTLLTRTDLSVGDHAVTLVVTDDVGATDSASVSITVESNGQPTADITSPSDGATFQETESISFEGSGSDPEDGPLTGSALVWTSDVDGEIGTGETFTRSDLSSGDHTITLAATDSRNAATTTSVAVTVEGDPTVTISSPADSSIFDEGAAVSLQGSATDPGDGPLGGSSLVWSSDVDGEFGMGESLSESGLSPGPHTITLTATDSEGSEGSASIELLVEDPDGFDIRIREIEGVSPSVRTAVEDALKPWQAAITGDLGARFAPPPDTTTADGDPEFPDDVNACLSDAGGGIDDLLVCVFVRPVDGEDQTLAFAGPNFIRVDTDSLPYIGRVVIDEVDLPNLTATELRAVITHEVGHVLGIGIDPVGDWGTNTQDLDTRDPYFSGIRANTAFEALGGEAYLSDGVPVANTGGSGTRGGHWRETNFDNELMTGFINQGMSNPLSRVTLAALADVGYQMDLSQAESYTLPMPQLALWEAEADATLSSGAPDTNFGSPGSVLGDTLVLGRNNRPWTSAPDTARFASLIRFAVPSIPSGVTASDASLELLITERAGDTTGHDVDLRPVTQSWTETGVTWSSRPDVGSASLDTLSQNLCSLCAFRSAELVDLAQAWGDGSTPNHGLYLEDTGIDADSVYSIGFWTRHAPTAGGLVIRIPQMRVLAGAGGAPLGALRQAPAGEKIPLGDDILHGPIYVVEPDGSVRRLRTDGRVR